MIIINNRLSNLAIRRFGIVVSDFGGSWRDGNAFLAIVQCINPRLVNLQVCCAKSVRVCYSSVSVLLEC